MLRSFQSYWTTLSGFFQCFWVSKLMFWPCERHFTKNWLKVPRDVYCAFTGLTCHVNGPWGEIVMSIISFIIIENTTLKNYNTVQPKYITCIWPKIWGHPCPHTFVYFLNGAVFLGLGFPLCINERETSCCNSIEWHVRQLCLQQCGEDPFPVSTWNCPHGP